MFSRLLMHCRREGLSVGIGEWLGLLEALRTGLITDLNGLYKLGRALLCRSETEFDAWDQAFAAAFDQMPIPDDLRAAMEAWVKKQVETFDGERVDPGMTDEELWETFLERLREQKEEHNGGNRWIGTGGTSPFGHGGKASRGVRVGGSGGGRSAITAATERRWANYRTDRVLDVRDMSMALRELRNLARQGAWELDLPHTIRATCDNAGDIDIVERRERQNQVHVVLLMDAGGSMTPHYERVSNLFSAASQSKAFKSFKAYSFHNCVYGWLYNDIENFDRVRTDKVLENLTPKHRLIFVGDASMAPYELFTPFSWPGDGQLAGIEWLRRFHHRCKASVWLNPDPTRYWEHPTVGAIGQIFEMHELTLDGLRASIKRLRAPV